MPTQSRSNPFKEAIKRATRAADARGEADRRRMLGSDREIARRAERNQGREAAEERGMKKGGSVMKGKKYAKGGSVSKRADGVAKKGRTKTKMIAMACGGSAGMKRGK